MKEMIWHMLTGAGSLLDISGHSKVSKSQAKSLRLKLDDEDFYTSPSSDQANLILDSSEWLPEQDRKIIQDWIGVCQQERDRFKAYVDEGFTYPEKYLKSIKFKK